MKRYLLLFSFLLTFSLTILAQTPQVQIPLTVSDGTDSAILNFGLDPNATDGIDATLGERELPPLPPSGVFDARFLLPVNYQIGSLADYRLGYDTTKGKRTYRISYQVGTGSTITLSWDLPTGVTGSLSDILAPGGLLVKSIPMSGTGNYTVPNSAITALDMTITYNFVAKPAIPTLVSPQDAEMGVGLNPTLTWKSAIDADTYHLQIGDDENFASITKDTVLTDTSYQITSVLTNNTSYWWKVSATNAGGTSNYSSVFNFTTKLSTPTLTLPTDNATGVSLTPTLTWSAVTGADTYRLEVNTENDFTGTVVYDNNALTSTSKQIGGLNDNTTYYWRVTAMSGGGNTSDVSSVSGFTTIKASLISPSNGATGVSINPTLSWPQITGADNYRLEVNTKNDFTGTVVFDDAALTTTSKALSGLTNNTTYYWRVSASSNALSKVNTSDVYSFTIKLSTPTLTSPTDNATGVSLTPTLTWTAVTGADIYRLEVNTKNDFTGTKVFDDNTLTTASKQVGSLTDNTAYYWRVTALTTGGNTSDVSAVSGFTTEKAALTSPADGEISVSLSPTLSWPSVTGADNYRLEVNTKNDFTGTVVFDDAALTTTSKALSGLTNNTTYYWRVSASSNALSKVNTSDVYSFTTKLSTPTLTLPTDNATGVSLTPTLTWAAVTGADIYRLEVNTKNDFTGTKVFDDNTLTTASKQVGSLTDNTAYYWRVTALTTGGNTSDVSAVSGFTTLVTPPANLGTNAIDINKVAITWSDNSNNEDGYKLERTDAESSIFNLLKDLAANTSSYTDTTVQEGKHYKYRVKAYSQTVESAYSNESTILTPISTIEPPSEVTVEPDTAGNFEITWNDNSDNEDGFIIQRGVVDSGSTSTNAWSLSKIGAVTDLIPTFVPIDTVSSNSVKYTDTDTKEGTSYIYQVEAFNSDGVSVPKTDSTKTTVSALLAPSNLTLTIMGTTSMKVMLEWVNNSNIYSGVLIERGDNDSTNYILVDSVASGISTYTDSLLNIGHDYYYRLKAYNSNSSSAYVYATSGIITDVESFDSLLPKEYTLYQNYPNPFNPSTTIRFSLPVESKVQIKIFNILGQVVKELLNSSKSAGNYKLVFNANNLASGIYFYRIIAKSVDGKNNFITTKKLILMK